MGAIYCHKAEFNQQSPNSNTWMFRDTDWPYESTGQTLALSTITFEVQTGNILDVDVEVNSFQVEITTADTGVVNDLGAIATHETGHFLGLSHSRVPGATMNYAYQPGDLTIRTLDPDDVAGVCAAYPPDRNVPKCTAPNLAHGFTRFCSQPKPPSGKCTAAPGRPSGAAPSVLGALAAVAAVAAARRRRGRASSSTA